MDAEFIVVYPVDKELYNPDIVLVRTNPESFEPYIA